MSRGENAPPPDGWAVPRIHEPPTDEPALSDLIELGEN